LRELFERAVAISGLVVATGSVGTDLDSTGVDGVFRVDSTFATFGTFATFADRFLAATLVVDVFFATFAVAAIFVASRFSQLLTVVCGTS
jgi:hypothetical protein